MFGPGITEAALALPVEKPFDTEFKYNNANSQIVGAALSAGLAKKGETYAQYLSRRLWCPLGNAPASLWVEAPGKPRFYAGINASLRDWARVGEMIRLEGRVGEEQLVPGAWVRAMAAPSTANPGYGWQIWRGSPWVAQRRYSPEASLAVPHSAAYAADDVLFLDGFGGQRVYVVPSAGLVIARTGETDLTWDDAMLVNLALGGLPRKASMVAQASMAAKP
jgi:CubicO group peptidase (beta-lactamase class C family)